MLVTGVAAQKLLTQQTQPKPQANLLNASEAPAPTQHNAKALSCVISTPLGRDAQKHLLQFGCMSRHNFPSMLPQ